MGIVENEQSVLFIVHSVWDRNITILGREKI